MAHETPPLSPDTRGEFPLVKRAERVEGAIDIGKLIRDDPKNENNRRANSRKGA